MRSRILRLLPAVVLLACQAAPNVPKIGNLPVTLSVTVSAVTLQDGIPDTIRVTSLNTTAQVLQLDFPTSCTIVVSVRNTTGTVVAPPNDDHGCAVGSSTLKWPANAAVVQTVIWAGATRFLPEPQTDRLPAGEYFVSARMDGFGYSAVAPAVKITIPGVSN